MVLADLAGWFEGRGCGTRAVDLFLGFLPPDPDAAAAMLEVGGLPARRAFDGVLWEAPRVQVLVRGGDYAAGRTLAESYHDAALALGNEVLASGARYLQAEPLQPPFHVERDERGRALFSLNLQVWRTP